MSKKLLTSSLVLLLFSFQLFASGNSSQTAEQKVAKQLVNDYLKKNQQTLKLTEDDIANWYFSDFYTDKKTGITHAYVQQTIESIKIFNAVSAVSIKNAQISSFAQRLFPNAKGNSNTVAPGITPKAAIESALAHLGLTATQELQVITSNNSTHHFVYSNGGVSQKDITADLVFQNVGRSLRLAYNVNLRVKDGSHWWNIRIDAVSGTFLSKNDWTVKCDFGAPTSDVTTSQSSSSMNVAYRAATTNTTNSIASYRVYPFPTEAPSFGPSVLLPDPSDAVASPFGWHDTDGNAGPEFTITRGNNVYAYDDAANIDSPGSSPDGTGTLTFDFPANLTQPANTYTDAANVNLFYVNNMVHDYLVHYGFDEAAGNFQNTNYSGNGAGNDYVIAESQDGGGTNNANFSTPDDGQNGWMQMYLWSGTIVSTLVVNSPAPIANSYNVVAAGFGPSITVPITQDIVLVDDGNAPTSDACEPIVNGAALAGKIALIDRGTCNFANKVFEAETAGAVAAIIINNDATAPFAMSGNGTVVNIPSVMISQANGNLIRAQLNLGNTVNGTLNPSPSVAVDIDGSLDNGIISHEFGHGVSNRLTGGPNNSNCLFNGEEGGEGWSDWFALMFTQKAGDQGTDARGVGTFALGEATNDLGIRRYPYSTDMAINPQTYGDLAISGEVHDIGEIWCQVLWDLNWALIDLDGFDADWYNGTAGNNTAMKLVIEGMKLQPCGPGFLDGRDAILAADDNLYGGIHRCLIWEVFARRGMGYNASQGDAGSAGDETEDFSIPPFCQNATTTPTANFTSDVTETCFGVVHFTDQSTDIPQQWSWDFGDGGTSTIQNPTHTYATPGVYTVSLTVTNTLGNDVETRVSYISVTSDPAPTVTGNQLVCPGQTTTLTATLANGNTIEWYDGSNNLVSTNTVFTTPLLNTNTTYTVRQITPTPLQFVGPTSNAFGGGGYHNTSFEGTEYFTTLTAVKIKSVLVYATGATDRTFNLYTSTGTLIQAKTIFVPDGQSRVTLDFDIPTAGNYQLGVTAGSNLYRNNAGASYPYTIPGLLSITSSNSTSNQLTYYYYCYDWEVQELPCASSYTTVNLTVTNPIASYAFSSTGLTVTFTDNSIGNVISYTWTFGDGQTANVASPVHTFAADGTYTVNLHIETSDGCTSDFSQVITISANGIAEVLAEAIDISSKNDQLTVKFDHVAKDAQIRITDLLGQVLFSTSFSKGNVFTHTMNEIAGSYVLVNVIEGDRTTTKKVFMTK